MTPSGVFPHAELVDIGDDVFLVRGSLLLNPLIRISRNMVVLRQGGELVLVNPIRLGEAGMQALERLGRIRHIVCLGAMHGRDDAWYRAQYQVQTWARPGSRRYPAPPDVTLLDPGRALPVDGAQLFCFATSQPESALLLERDGGLLITCDCLQHYGDYHQHSPMARLVMPFIGFPKTTVVGPIWLKEMTPPGGSLRGEFERLLQWRFDGLIAAHGSHLPRGAHASAVAAVNKAFG